MAELRLLETILSIDGVVQNLSYHQSRVNNARTNFGFYDVLSLTLTPPQTGVYRCRILYGKHILKIEYFDFIPKIFKKLKIVQSTINYAFKYEDREELNTLLIPEYDDVIIVKNDLVTDTSIANLAFLKEGVWFTPRTPLLEGTTRARLINEKKLVMADIRAEDIQNYEKVAMMNALYGFNILKNIIID